MSGYGLKPLARLVVDDDDFPDQVEESDVSMSSTARGKKSASKSKASAPAMKAAAPRKTTAARGKQTQPLVSVRNVRSVDFAGQLIVSQFDEDDEDDEEDEEEEFVPRAQRGANGRAAAPKKATTTSRKTPAPAKKTAVRAPARQSQLT